MSSQVVLPLGDLVAGAIERQYPHKRSLECMAVDEDGTAILWNRAGHGVEVSPEDQLAVVSLLLRRYIRADRLEETALQAGGLGDLPSAQRFKALANILIRIVPGDDLQTVLVEARRMQDEGTFRVPDEFDFVLRLHTAECNLQAHHFDRGEDLPTRRHTVLITIDAYTNLVRAWDDTAVHTFGYTRDEVLGVPLPIVGNEAAFNDAIEKVKERRRPLTFAEIHPQHKYGHPIPCAVAISPIPNAHGEVEALTLTATPLPQSDPSVQTDTQALEQIIKELTTPAVRPAPLSRV